MGIFYLLSNFSLMASQTQSATVLPSRIASARALSQSSLGIRFFACSSLSFNFSPMLWAQLTAIVFSGSVCLYRSFGDILPGCLYQAGKTAFVGLTGVAEYSTSCSLNFNNESPKTVIHILRQIGYFSGLLQHCPRLL